MLGAMIAALVAPLPRAARLTVARRATRLGGAGLVANLLDDPDATVRCVVIQSAGGLGGRGGQIAEKLARLAIRDDDRRVRRMAFDALRSLGAHALPALAALTPLLRDQDAARRRRALSVIAAIGPDARAAAADAVRLSRDKNRYVSEAARGATTSLKQH